MLSKNKNNRKYSIFKFYSNNNKTNIEQAFIGLLTKKRDRMNTTYRAYQTYCLTVRSFSARTDHKIPNDWTVAGPRLREDTNSRSFGHLHLRGVFDDFKQLHQK